MSETIIFHALDLSGETTLKLFLRKDDGSLLNTGGDALAEIGGSGVFEATFTESRTGLGTLSVRVCDGTETADNLLYDDFLPESSTVIGAKRDAALNATTQTQINNIETGTNTLLSRVTTTVVTLWANLTAMITGSGASAKYTTGALSNAPGSEATISQEGLDTIIAGVQAVHLNITEAVENCGFSITSSDTWIQSVTGLGNLTDKKVTFTIKSDRRDVDSAAIVFLDEAIGLLYLNGAVTTTSWGSITIDDETAGNITLRLESDATHLIPTGKYIDAIKVIKDNADFSLRNAGTTTVLCGVIKEHS